MRRQTRLGIFTAALTFFAHAALAVPTLQLDIIDGVYDTTTQTIVSTGDTFTLLAILTPSGNDDISALLDDTYYISSALTPSVDTDTNLGSFDFDGTTYDVTADMVYGVPPLESNLFQDPGDLSTHGIFPTYFTETGFQFDPNMMTATYNSQDDPGGLDTSGTGSYYVAFEVDVSSLSPDHEIHFDLYNTVAKDGTDIDKDDFAPFSHDAESGPGPGGPGPGPGPGIPEPSTLLLFGAGLLALSKRRV